MKPTPTPEMIEAHAIADAKFAGMDFATLGRADKKRFLERAASCLSAALSVQPAAAVVGELQWNDEDMALHWIDRYAAGLDGEPQMDRILDCVGTAAPSAPEGWQPIESAPKDGTEILAYGYARCDGSRYANGPHIAWWDAELGWTGRDPDDRVTLHPSHWRPLPAPPAIGGKP